MIKDIDLINYVANICIETSKLLLGYFSKGFEIEKKFDNSFVTNADRDASKYIIEKLKITNIPCISEEEKTPDYNIRKDWKTFWLIDPIDGTKSFVNKKKEFCICIALIENNSPKFGFIYIPFEKTLFYGGKNIGAYKINTENNTNIDLLVNLSEKLPLSLYNPINVFTGNNIYIDKYKRIIDNLFDYEGNIEYVKIGSAIKFCRIAEGKVNHYLRTEICMEWDIAAGHAIINGVNKNIVDIDSMKELEYNKENLACKNFIVL